MKCILEVSNYEDSVAAMEILMQYQRNHITKPTPGSAIDQLDLSSRTHNCLNRAGITNLSELVGCTRLRLLRVPNFGRACLDEVVRALDKRKLSMAPDFGGSDD